MSDTKHPLGETETHESWGMVGLTRVSTTGQYLFNSPLIHSNYMVMRVKRATKSRSLGHNWLFGREDIVEIAMSESQFAEFITTPNRGDGVACTIQRVHGKRMEECPFEDTRETFRSDLKKNLETLTGETKEFQDAIKTVLESTKLTKAEKANIANLAERINRTVSSNIPHMQTTMMEHMEKVVQAAKTDFEAHVTHAVHEMGMESLRNTAPKFELPAASEEVPEGEIE